MSTAFSSDAIQVLTQTTPFMFLPGTAQEDLARTLVRREFSAGEVIFDQGSAALELMLVFTGKVAILDPSKIPTSFQGFIGPNAYFGDYGILFETTHPRQAIAETQTVCFSLSAEKYLDLIRQSTIFAQSVSRNLRERQGLFQALNRLRTTIAQGSAQGQINFETLLIDYRKLNPALHSGSHSSELDFGGWEYAVRRLPTNITHCHVYLLARTLPTLLGQAAIHAEAIPTLARRRTTYALSSGKSVVLVRDAQTDLCDFLTNLALHAHEARKLRRRIRSADVLMTLSEALRKGDKACRKCLDDLPLTDVEIDALHRIWPDNLVARLYEMLLHHEDYSVFVDKALYNYNADSAERWCRQIQQACLDLMGSLEDIEVDIVSSNTHSVVNCLSPFLHSCKAEILAWGKRHMPELDSANFRLESDRLYALSYHWFKASPEEQKARYQAEMKHGIRTLTSTEFTGLQVDLIRVDQLDETQVDDELKDFERHSRRLIINIDYAFGCQAEDIMGCLILLFGHRIRSINVLGKAGALVGNRGDILLPNRIVNQADETIHCIDQSRLSDDDFECSDGYQVHRGPMLTVLGTLLQNRELLCYYKHLWDCVGLEMEGSYYARQIERSKNLGMLRDDLETRFLYYVSDLPLDHGSNLSKRLQPWEGIPPLYGVARLILAKILFDD